MRIAVCDDERNQTELTTGYIRAWAEKRGEQAEVFAYFSAAELLYHWSEGKSFDMAFLDIRMKNMTGVELARIFRKSDDRMAIVFISGLKDYVFQGYEVQALQYLLKPVREADCFACLDRARELVSLRGAETFLIPVEGRSVRLLYDEICTFEIFSHYIEVKSTKGTFTFKKKMDELEQELPGDRFFRCHRSFPCESALCPCRKQDGRCFGRRDPNPGQQKPVECHERGVSEILCRGDQV